jgi:uncharacterized protein
MIRNPSTSAPVRKTPPPWLVAQRWESLLFAHWRVDPAPLRAVLPPGVEPDVREGSGWLAIVAFLMVGTRSCGPPWWPVLAPIAELNVRTYVRVHGVPAVWFLSLDASSTFFATLGRMLYGMRYHVADMQVAEEGGCVRFRSARRGGAFAATYAPAGVVATAEPGSLEHFLVERYRLFAERRGRLITAEVAHEPWPLQRATAQIDVKEMAPSGIDLSGEPLVHFCRSVTAVISAPSAADSVQLDGASALGLAPPRAGARGLVEPPGRERLPADAA